MPYSKLGQAATYLSCSLIIVLRQITLKTLFLLTEMTFKLSLSSSLLIKCLFIIWLGLQTNATIFFHDHTVRKRLVLFLMRSSLSSRKILVSIANEPFFHYCTKLQFHPCTVYLPAVQVVLVKIQVVRVV